MRCGTTNGRGASATADSTTSSTSAATARSGPCSCCTPPTRSARSRAAHRPRRRRAPRGERQKEDEAQPHLPVQPVPAVRPPRIGVPTLADINRKKLSAYASGESFVSALNTVDAAHILRGAAADVRHSAVDPDTGQTPAWVDSLLARGRTTVFVTVGRLSPEKNQARLLRAFAAVHAQHPLTKLFIVGDGPLRGDLQRLIDSLGLTGAALPHREAAESALDHGGVGLLRALQRLRGPAHGDPGGTACSDCRW